MRIYKELRQERRGTGPDEDRKEKRDDLGWKVD